MEEQSRIMIQNKYLNYLAERKNLISVTGLGVLMAGVGVSKFLVTGFWMGYEPQILVETLPLTATQLTLASGIAEILIGLALFSQRKKFYISGFTFLWLAAITVRVSTMGLWDIAIRDLGLTFYALSVALDQYSST